MTQKIIVIAGNPSWFSAISDALSFYSVKVQHYHSPIGYVKRLAENLAALVLVDGDAQDWRYWTVTPKASPATRRIPIVVVTNDVTRINEALTTSADYAMSFEELIGNLSTLVTQVARGQSEEEVDDLSTACDEPLPPEGISAIAQFNAGDYYHQHDTFEALWMAEERPIRDLYRAILQVGIAYYQITLGNWRVAHKMLLRSIQWLAPLPNICRGVDIAQLRADATAVRIELERVGEQGIVQFDRSLLRSVRLINIGTSKP